MVLPLHHVSKINKKKKISLFHFACLFFIFAFTLSVNINIKMIDKQFYKMQLFNAAVDIFYVVLLSLLSSFSVNIVIVAQ